MITGIVNADFEPIIPLLVCGSDGKIDTQDAIVDTGFNGWLSLPPDLITQLNLTWKRRGRAILGDEGHRSFRHRLYLSSSFVQYHY
ncbi:MAG: hypothetical protein RLZZ435_3104 [Cyanobacteriota bacterium]